MKWLRRKRASAETSPASLHATTGVTPIELTADEMHDLIFGIIRARVEPASPTSTTPSATATTPPPNLETAEANDHLSGFTWEAIFPEWFDPAAKRLHSEES